MRCYLKFKKQVLLHILADEVADISNTDQLSLEFRFVDENNVIKEEYVHFLPCLDRTSGQAIASLILDRISAVLQIGE